MNVLIVEDDSLLAEGLATALRRASYGVVHAPDGRTADQQLRAGEIDLVVLDLGLPDMDGLDVLRALRQRKQPVPVLVLTARDSIDQQVESLDAGADDYMEKPFDLRELQARVRALLRRGYAEMRDKLSLGPLELDPFEKTANLKGQRLDLAQREFEILEALLSQAPRVVGKARLNQRLALQAEDIGPNAVEVYVHRLRRHLDRSGVLIRTVRGVGYAIEYIE